MALTRKFLKELLADRDDRDEGVGGCRFDAASQCLGVDLSYSGECGGGVVCGLGRIVGAAVNATVRQIDETAAAEMGKLTGGMNIPGL